MVCGLSVHDATFDRMKNRAATITYAASALVIAGLVALAIPAIASATGIAAPAAEAAAAAAAEPTPTAEPVAKPEQTAAVVTVLPEWARTGTTWLIYPDGFECVGTEGCPNDFRRLIGEPGDVLPEGVEYYDPAKHDYNPATNTGMVFPAHGPTEARHLYIAAMRIDKGAIYGATGTAHYDAEGNIATYTVAPNDSLVAIGERFGLDYARILDAPVDTIHPGDILTLR